MKTFAVTFLCLLAAASSIHATDVAQKPIIENEALSKTEKPNIIFILVDDQDLQMDSLSYTPIARRELMDKGTFYKNHFVTTALCCPSRVSLWTGRQAHNTNVTDVNIPYGGYPKFVSEGWNENWFPVWMQENGYDTYYTGKLYNYHSVDTYDKPHVKGFNGSDFLLDPFTYWYMNSTWQRNHNKPKSYEGFHTTDVIAVKAYDFLDDALNIGNPFFMAIAPVAPHSNLETDSLDLGPGSDRVNLKVTGPIPLPRHAHLFPDAKVPRTPNFNPDKPSGVNWISKLPKMPQENIDYNDDFYRRRLQALQGPEEIIAGVIDRLEEHGQLNNTYILYTSDNGYHIGQHRMQPGKECGYEEDVRVPMFIRGPGVPAGQVVDTPTTHIDLVPTMFEMAGIPLKSDFDGTPLPITQESVSDPEFLRHEHIAIEYWGMAVGEGRWGKEEPIDTSPTIVHLNNTYKALRVIGESYNLYYSVWCNNEHQLYDLTTDPYELNNLWPNSTVEDSSTYLLGYPLAKVISRLDALILVLKSCKGVTCVKPWTVLHPEGDVETLQDALDADFDSFYTAQVKVSYDRCEFGYLIDAEGPQVGLAYRDGISWSEWV